MKSISLLVLLLGFSVQNAYAEKVTVNAKELERIYQLQESKAGLSFPALFIYDTQNQRYLTQQEVFNYLKIATEIELTEHDLSTLRHYIKPIIKPDVSIAQMKQVTKVIEFTQPYVAFYHDIDNDMLASIGGDGHIASQSKIMKILQSAKNIQVYTYTD